MPTLADSPSYAHLPTLKTPSQAQTSVLITVDVRTTWAFIWKAKVLNETRLIDKQLFYI